MNKSDKIFLLNPDVTSLLHDIQDKPKKYTLFFTKIKLCKEIQYKKYKKNYTKKVKSGVGYAQRTYGIKISKRQFQKAHKKHLAHILYIDRYTIKVKQYPLHLYAYKDMLSGLYLLHIPYKVRHLCNDILSSSIWTEYIEKEVTEDPRYEDKHIALLGNPSKQPYNIYAIFKDLENKRINHVNEVIFEEMKTSDAIRIKLYALFIQLNQYRKELEDSQNDSKILQQFRTTLKKSKLILSEYHMIFEEDMFQKIFQHLSMILKITKTEKDLFLIKKKFHNLNQKLNNEYIEKLINNIESKISEEHKKISKFFATREFAIIHEQYKLFLVENNKSYANYDAQTSIAYSSTLKLKSLQHKVVKLSDKLDGCNDDKSYDKLEQEFRKFSTFIETFSKVLQCKEIEDIMDKAQASLVLLKKHQKQNKSLLITTMMQNQLQNLTPTQIQQLHKYKKSIKAAQKELDQTVNRSFNIFKQIQI